MSKLISEQSLQQEIESLPQKMSPERDLWPGIERAIHGKSQVNTTHKKHIFTSGAWAASIVTAVLVTWVTLKPTEPQIQVAAVDTMQRHFEQQKQTMLISFGQPSLTELPIEMQKELQKLTSAQATIKKALQEEPDNSDLLNLLRWTQKQELDLLKQLFSPQWQTI